MAEIARFMNSTEDDQRIYDAQDFDFAMQTILGSPYDASRVGTGVSRYYRGSESDQLLVVTANGADMVTTVSVGSAVVYGKFYELTEPKQLPHEPAHATLPRVDRVVLRLDNRIDQRTMSVEIIKGEPSATRVPPDLKWTEDIKEIALASVDIVAGRSYITQADVLDTRAYKEVCGFLPLHNTLRGLEVDSSGIVSFKNQSLVEVDKDITTSFAENVDTPLPLSGAKRDNQNELKDGYKFVPKTPGVYNIFGYIAFTQGSLPIGTEVAVSIYINGVYITIITEDNVNDTKRNIFSGTIPYYLDRDDELQIWCRVNKGSSGAVQGRNLRAVIQKST